MAISFDPHVFDLGVFDARYPTPTLHRVSIPRQFQKVLQGTTIPITIYIIETDTTPGRTFSFSPENVYIQIYKPDSTIRSSYTFMNNIGLGAFYYSHVTISQDVPGKYTGNILMASGDKLVITDIMFFFEIVTQPLVLQPVPFNVFDPNVFDPNIAQTI